MRSGPVRTVILVEGESDEAAVRAAARVLSFDGAGLAIRVMHGVTNVARVVEKLVGTSSRIAGLFDAAEEHLVARALAEAGILDQGDVGDHGFFACEPCLESELIAALGNDRVVDVLRTQGGDLRRFRSLQQMPEWRDRPVDEQLRRWFGSGSGRKVRYAALLVDAMLPGEVPGPLRRVLEFAAASPRLIDRS